jgi:hypothetical protein
MDRFIMYAVAGPIVAFAILAAACQLTLFGHATCGHGLLFYWPFLTVAVWGAVVFAITTFRLIRSWREMSKD